MLRQICDICNHTDPHKQQNCPLKKWWSINISCLQESVLLCFHRWQLYIYQYCQFCFQKYVNWPQISCQFINLLRQENLLFLILHSSHHFVTSRVDYWHIDFLDENIFKVYKSHPVTTQSHVIKCMEVPSFIGLCQFFFQKDSGFFLVCHRHMDPRSSKTGSFMCFDFKVNRKLLWDLV